jgi:hypothetical protein
MEDRSLLPANVLSFKRISGELVNLYSRKNQDYGDAFHETYKKLGIISAITRLSDKMHRIVTLGTKSSEEQQVKNESIIDTLVDLAAYSIMTIIELEENKTK